MREETGFIDSNSAKIYFGDKVTLDVETNTEIHGDYAVYDVIKKGSIPFLSYLESEKGQVIPRGYLSSLLSSHYDQNSLNMFLSFDKLKPITRILVMR